MKTIKELHGDLFEEGTEFRIADNFGDDPDAVWISRQDFEILGARPTNFLSRIFFLYYKGDERKRIVCVDHDLLHGQIKLNMDDYGDFVAKDDAYRLNLFRPYRILLEQYLIFEKFSKNKITGLLMAEARKFYRKLLLFYDMYTDSDEKFSAPYRLYQTNLYRDVCEMRFVRDGKDKSQKIMNAVLSLCMFYESLQSELALPMKIPELLSADDVREFLEVQDYIRKKGHTDNLPETYQSIWYRWRDKTIPFIDYMHWDELSKQRKQMKADNETIMRQLDLIIAIWHAEVAPIIEQWENEQ